MPLPGIETLKRLANRETSHVLVKPSSATAESENLDELKAKYLAMIRAQKSGPFDDEYIDHENEG